MTTTQPAVLISDDDAGIRFPIEGDQAEQTVLAGFEARGSGGVEGDLIQHGQGFVVSGRPVEIFGAGERFVARSSGTHSQQGDGCE